MRNKTSPLGENIRDADGLHRSLSDRIARLLLWLRTPGTAGRTAQQTTRAAERSESMLSAGIVNKNYDPGDWGVPRLPGCGHEGA